MPLRPDVHDILEVFVYDNLNVMINTIANPAAVTAATALAASNTKFLSPQALIALQAVVLDNFKQLDLKPDLEEISRIFFATLPPVAPVITPTTPLTPTPPTNSLTPTTL